MADVNPIKRLGRKAPDISSKNPVDERIVLDQTNIGAIKGTPILNSLPVKKEWWRK